MKDGGYRCVYDFDTHLYTNAKMLENNFITVKHIATGHEMNFKNITTFKGRSSVTLGGWLAERNEKKGTDLKLEDFEITDRAERNDIKPFLPKKLIKASINAVLKKPWCRELKLIIGGKDNYRKELWPLYKANRPPKPIMYNKVRSWLEKEYKDLIVIAKGCEADDYLSIMMNWMRRECGGDFNLWDLVLIHRDKDMIQCGGYQWDWFKKSKEPVWITEHQMAKSFWVQMLMGDTTDNIPGLKAITQAVKKEFGCRGTAVGEVTAKLILDGCKKSLDMEQIVLYCYQTYWDSVDGDWKKEFQLNYQMLKLMERKGVVPIYEFKD